MIVKVNQWSEQNKLNTLSKVLVQQSHLTEMPAHVPQDVPHSDILTMASHYYELHYN